MRKSGILVVSIIGIILLMTISGSVSAAGSESITLPVCSDQHNVTITLYEVNIPGAGSTGKAVIPVWISGQSGSFQLEAKNGIPPYHWEVKPGSQLPGQGKPQGFSLSERGVLSGTAPVLPSGQQRKLSPSFTVMVWDSDTPPTCDEESLTITFEQPGVSTPAATTIPPTAPILTVATILPTTTEPTSAKTEPTTPVPITTTSAPSPTLPIVFTVSPTSPTPSTATTPVQNQPAGIPDFIGWIIKIFLPSATPAPVITTIEPTPSEPATVTTEPTTPTPAPTTSITTVPTTTVTTIPTTTPTPAPTTSITTVPTATVTIIPTTTLGSQLTKTGETLACLEGFSYQCGNGCIPKEEYCFPERAAAGLNLCGPGLFYPCGDDCFPRDRPCYQERSCPSGTYPCNGGCQPNSKTCKQGITKPEMTQTSQEIISSTVTVQQPNKIVQTVQPTLTEMGPVCEVQIITTCPWTGVYDYYPKGESYYTNRIIEGVGNAKVTLVDYSLYTQHNSIFIQVGVQPGGDPWPTDCHSNSVLAAKLICNGKIITSDETNQPGVEGVDLTPP